MKYLAILLVSVPLIAHSAEQSTREECSASVNFKTSAISNCSADGDFHILLNSQEYAFPRLKVRDFSWVKNAKVSACDVPQPACSIFLHTANDRKKEAYYWPKNISYSPRFVILKNFQSNYFENSQFSKNVQFNDMNSERYGAFKVAKITYEREAAIPNFTDGVHYLYQKNMNRILAVCTRDIAEKRTASAICQIHQTLEHGVYAEYRMYANNFNEVDLYDQIKSAEIYIQSYGIREK